MNMKEFIEIEKSLCKKIEENDLLRHSLSDYQFRKYKEFRKGYLTALMEIRKIIKERDLVESEN